MAEGETPRAPSPPRSRTCARLAYPTVAAFVARIAENDRRTVMRLFHERRDFLYAAYHEASQAMAILDDTLAADAGEAAEVLELAMRDLEFEMLGCERATKALTHSGDQLAEKWKTRAADTVASASGPPPMWTLT